MRTYESNGETDCIYYPIEYTNKALANVITIAFHPNGEYTTWVIPIDKSKFLDGYAADWEKDSTFRFSFISIGF